MKQLFNSNFILILLFCALLIGLWPLSSSASGSQNIERIETKGTRWSRNDKEREIEDILSRLRIFLQEDGYSGSDFNFGAENENPADESCEEGNPVIVSSGTKIERVIDFIGNGQYPLSLERNYASTKVDVGSFGQGWSSVFDWRLELTTSPDGHPWPVFVANEMGKKLYFEAPRTVPPGELPEVSFPSVSGANVLDTTPDYSVWTLHHERGKVTVFNNEGRLIEVRDASSGR